MKKLAITYYHDMLRGYSHITLHDSGVAATEHFKKRAQDFFQMPIQWKVKNLKLTGKNRLSASLGMRGFYARFLDDEEVEVVKKFGDKTMVNHATGKLHAPEKVPL